MKIIDVLLKIYGEDTNNVIRRILYTQNGKENASIRFVMSKFIITQTEIMSFFCSKFFLKIVYVQHIWHMNKTAVIRITGNK